MDAIDVLEWWPVSPAIQVLVRRSQRVIEERTRGGCISGSDATLLSGSLSGMMRSCPDDQPDVHVTVTGEARSRLGESPRRRRGHLRDDTCQ